MHLQLVGSCHDPSSPKHAIAAAVEMTHPSNVLPSALASVVIHWTLHSHIEFAISDAL